MQIRIFAILFTRRWNCLCLDNLSNKYIREIEGICQNCFSS